MSEVPPLLMNGSGTPVRGNSVDTPAMFITAWKQIMPVIPAASRRPNLSRQRFAMMKPQTAMMAKRAMTTRLPRKPFSSAIMAKM